MSPLTINSHLTKCWCLVSPFCCCVSGFISGNTQGLHRRLSLMQKWKCQTLSGQLEWFSLCVRHHNHDGSHDFVPTIAQLCFLQSLTCAIIKAACRTFGKVHLTWVAGKCVKSIAPQWQTYCFLRLHLQKETAPSWVWSAVLPAASSWQHVCWTSFQIICLTSAASWKFGRSRCVFNCLSEWQSK